MLSPARFYRMKGALTSGEYPLFQQGQALAQYLVHEVTIKHTKDIQQIVRVPVFEGYRDVNVCEIEGLYYWVTAFHENTIEESSVRFVLDLMAPTSFITKGDVLKGVWKKTPYISNGRRMKQPVTNDVMKESSHTDFDTITMPDDIAEKMGQYAPDSVLWVQISSIALRKVLGCFCSYRKGFPFGQPYESAGSGLQRARVRVVYNLNPPSSMEPFYPSLNDIITSIYEISGQTITAEQIDNISISDKCPYSYHHEMVRFTTSTGGEQWAPRYWLDQGSVFNVGGSYIFYDLGQDPPSVVRKTKTVTLTDMQAIAGDVKIRDQMNNVIMTIPSEMFDSTGQVEVAYTTFNDMSGIFTAYDVGPLRVIRPEGKLPWIGSAAATYNAYSWDNDRLAMQYANNEAQRNFEADWNYYIGQANIGIRRAQRNLDESSIMAFGSAITLGGGVGDLIGNWFTQQHIHQDNAEDRDLIAKKLEASKINLMLHNQEQYDLTVKRAISQPNPTYNTGYGMTYCQNSLNNKCRISVDLPSNLTQQYFDNWITEYGYATEGVIDMVMTEGFYSGSLLSNGELVGLYFDELNKDFMRGFKFIEP